MIWRRRYEVVVLGESGSASAQRSVISDHRTEREAREAASQERRRLEVIRAEEAASWVVMVVRADEVLHEERPFDGRRESVPVSPLGPLTLTQRDPVPAPGDDEPAADLAPAGVAAAGEPAAGEQEADEQVVDEAAPGDHATGTFPGAAPADAAADPAPDEPADGETGRAMRPSPRGRAPATRPGDEDWDIDTFAVERVSPPERERPAPAEPAAATVGAPAGGDAGDAPRRRRDEDIPSGPVPDDVIRRFEESIARAATRARQRGSRPPGR